MNNISSISNSDQKSDNDKRSSELDYFDENVYDSDDSPVVEVNGDEADELNEGAEADKLREGDEAVEFNEGAGADETGRSIQFYLDPEITIMCTLAV